MKYKVKAGFCVRFVIYLFAQREIRNIKNDVKKIKMLTVFIAILASKLSTQLRTRSTCFSPLPPRLKHYNTTVGNLYIINKLLPASNLQNDEMLSYKILHVLL